MIEVEPWRNIFPITGGVAGFAGFLELSFVRIDVALRAGVELHVLVAD